MLCYKWKIFQPSKSVKNVYRGQNSIKKFELFYLTPRFLLVFNGAHLLGQGQKLHVHVYIYTCTHNIFDIGYYFRLYNNINTTFSSIN